MGCVFFTTHFSYSHFLHTSLDFFEVKYQDYFWLCCFCRIRWMARSLEKLLRWINSLLANGYEIFFFAALIGVFFPQLTIDIVLFIRPGQQAAPIECLNRKATVFVPRQVFPLFLPVNQGKFFFLLAVHLFSDGVHKGNCGGSRQSTQKQNRAEKIIPTSMTSLNFA